MPPTPTILITAAEASGDAHAAGLVEALRRRLGRARFVGIGGEKMAAAGCELLAWPARRASMLTAAGGQVAYYLGLIRKVARAIDEYRPAVHVPVDSPALNWHLARAARRRGAAVVYYIAPQVWAWAPWRVRKLRRLTDAVACILPFEQEYFRRRGVNAHFVGHPLFDHLPAPDPPDLGTPSRSGRWRIALLPGSRQAEIRHHAAALATAMDLLRQRWARAEFAFVARDEASAEWIRRHAGRGDLPIHVGEARAVLARSHLALAASGTVTLEAAHFGVPMVIFYRVGKWPYRLVGRWLIRTRHLSLVNILAGEEVVPELMPWFGDVEELVAAVDGLLLDVPRMQDIRRRLGELTSRLHLCGSTAADNAAELVVQALHARRRKKQAGGTLAFPTGLSGGDEGR